MIIKIQKGIMRKINCWEFKKCGRQLGGENEKEFGVCPASFAVRFNSINGGVNGGRYCWGTKDTLCEFDISGTFAKDMATCANCGFYQSVRNEEGPEFVE